MASLPTSKMCTAHFSGRVDGNFKEFKWMDHGQTIGMVTN